MFGGSKRKLQMKNDSNTLQIEKVNKVRVRKITHDYKCQVCGEPATVSYQTIYKEWGITPSGKFLELDEDCADDSEFYCDECNPNS